MNAAVACSCLTLAHDRGISSSSHTQRKDAEEQNSALPYWATLDCLLALDDAVGLSAYFSCWGRSLAKSSMRIIVSGGESDISQGKQSTLITQQSVRLSVSSGPGDSIKSAMARIVMRERRSRPMSVVSRSSRPASAGTSYVFYSGMPCRSH